MIMASKTTKSIINNDVYNKRHRVHPQQVKKRFALPCNGRQVNDRPVASIR
jgi:hypothetical protein